MVYADKKDLGKYVNLPFIKKVPLILSTEFICSGLRLKDTRYRKYTMLALTLNIVKIASLENHH